MTNSKTTKRALLTSVMALVLCFAMLTGTTFAWFTDTETSSGNKIVAGNLDIQLLMWDGDGTEDSDYIDIGKDESPIFGAGSIAQNNNAQTVWEPGKTQIAYLALKNNGNLALKYQVSLDVENVAKNLYKVMEYAIVADKNNENLITETSWTAFNGLPVSEGLQLVSDAAVELPVGATHYFALAIHMQEEADNNYQQGEVNFDIIVNATQLNAEADSFGTDYDEPASLPYTVVSTAEELGEVLKNGGNAILNNDIALTEAMNVPEGVTVTLNLNGKAVSSPSDYAIENKGDLTINGNGTFSGLGIIRSTAGKLTINGGTYNASSKWQDSVYQHTLKAENTEVIINDGIFDATVNGQTNAVLNVSTGSTVTINGGTFKNVTGDLSAFDPYLFTYENDGKLIIKDGTFYGGWRFNGATATTDIYGGNFTVSYDGQSFNANSTHVLTVYGGIFAKGAKLTTDKLNDVVADEYEVKELNDAYIVVPQGASVATDTDSLNAAFDRGEKTIVLTEGTYSFRDTEPAIPAIPAGTTIIGMEGVEFNNTLKGTLTNVTLKNIYINAYDAQRWGGAEGDIVFEDCTFKATDYAIHYDRNQSGATVTYTNCTIIGGASIGRGAESITFDGCKIYGNGTLGILRFYGPATIKNCTFDVSNVNTEDEFQDGIHAVDCEIKVSNNTNVNGEMKDLYNVSGTGVITEE